MKIHPVGVESYHADGETDMTKDMVSLLNYANMLKNFVMDVVSFRP